MDGPCGRAPCDVERAASHSYFRSRVLRPATRRDHDGGIHRGVERGGRLGPVFHDTELYASLEKATYASARERAPELGRQQQGDASHRRREADAALDEERGEIHLRREAARRIPVAHAPAPTPPRERRRTAP